MHHDVREAAAAADLGPLPEWDLGDLYVSPQASELGADTEWLRGEALAFARDNHVPIAQAMQELGEQTGVVELEQLAGSLHLAAGEGSRIREALIQRGESLSDRLTADLEARAEAATERMSMPLMALTSIFLLALIFPAMAAFQSGA